ncbi:hypothetical protein [Shumkonia mesophila]|uniref:hypothetical protein n=1 Tax=Shumkonia mesophila TaxID=2838854 RepID=UPI0029352095|nr:hypothetical protein [Shumkonia mesophila]
MVEDLLPFAVEQWDAGGIRIERILARAANVLLASAAFDRASALYPDKVLTLRHGTRVVASLNLPD